MKIKHARKGLAVKMSASELEAVYFALEECSNLHIGGHSACDRLLETIDNWKEKRNEQR